MVNNIKKACLSITLLLSCLAMSGCVIVIADDKKLSSQSYQESQQAEGISKIKISSGEGNLTIIGQNHTPTILLSAHLYSVSGRVDISDNIRLTRKDDTLLITTKINGPFHNEWQEAEKIDIVLTLPDHLMLTIFDDGGDILIENMKNVIELDDGAGDINIAKVSANLIIEDNGGNIMVNDFTGDIKIEDGAGEIFLTNAKGKLTIADKGGDITINQTTQTVYIEDSAGDIEITDASNKVTIKDGSGDIKLIRVSDYLLLSDSAGRFSVLK